MAMVVDHNRLRNNEFRISEPILDSMTMDTPTRTLATERPACVYDPMVTPSVSRGSYGHYLRRNAKRSATQRAHKRASLSATDSITSDMADYTLEQQPNRTTRDSRTQDTAHLSHLPTGGYVYITPHSTTWGYLYLR